MVAMMMSIFLLPTLYVWVAGDRDVLPAPEAGIRRSTVRYRAETAFRFILLHEIVQQLYNCIYECN